MLPCVSGPVPKRISLPENLQPQMLLNLKQSIHVEKQLGGGDSATAVEPKQVLKARLHQQQQKRLTKARLQLLRQQSYQLAQRQPLNMMNLRIQEDPCGDPPCAPLSPIEDIKTGEEMDLS
jgi:hypothetical protein